MSKQALYYYAENLQLVQRATFTDSSGKVRQLGENGRDLLIFLCNGANEKRGYTFHFGHQFIAEETGLHVSTIKRLLAGFEQLGWITRTGELIRHHGRGLPTVEYALTFYPGATQNDLISRPTSRPVDTNNPGKANGEKDAHGKMGLETETEPQTETQTEPEPQRPDRAGLAGGGGDLSKEGKELLERLLASEDFSVANNPIGLRKYREREYIPIVQAWEKERPNADPVTWCREQRGYVSNPVSRNQRTTYLPEVPQGSQDCPQCEGSGTYNVPKPEGGWRAVYCDCTHKATQEATTERVSADKASNTCTPDPSAPADPGSDLIKQMTQKLHRRI